MRPHVGIPADSLWQFDRPHVIEEDEGTDHAPLCEGQDPPHFERTDAAPTFLYYELDHVARAATLYLAARIHSTSALRSASGTMFGGIGIAPQTPLPPLLTFFSSLTAGTQSSVKVVAKNCEIHSHDHSPNSKFAHRAQFSKWSGPASRTGSPRRAAS